MIAAAWLRRSAVAALATTALAGCTLLTPQVEPVPPGDMAADFAPIGPVIEVGRGNAMGRPWRFLVYESRIGTCTKIEYADAGDGPTSCGGSIDGGPESVTLMGFGGATGGTWDFQGHASDDVVAVWIEYDDGDRVPATLMSLEPAGHDGSIFFVTVEDGPFARVVGLDANGEEVGSAPIDAP